VLDVTDRSAAVAGLQTAAGRFGRIDVVVNNAGYANLAPVETTPEDDFRRQPVSRSADFDQDYPVDLVDHA
jgi:NAD(P)-dependent dehydrogenase (short-subunit alcohol dehydrogenase family)